MSDPHYVYVVVRRDIPLCHQITQSCHAAFEHGVALLERKHPGIAHLITLTVKDEGELLRLHKILQDQELPSCLFWEPDPLKGNATPMGHTALAAGPVHGADREWFSRLPLWEG